jgi:hypothetical protein
MRFSKITQQYLLRHKAFYKKLLCEAWVQKIKYEPWLTKKKKKQDHHNEMREEVIEGVGIK